MLNDRTTPLKVGSILILICDFGFADNNEIQAYLDALTELIYEKAEKYPGRLYTVGKFAELRPNPKVMKQFERFGKNIKSHVTAQTVIGVTGFKKALLNIHNKMTGSALKPFATQEEAIEYIKKHQLEAAKVSLQ